MMNDREKMRLVKVVGELVQDVLAVDDNTIVEGVQTPIQGLSAG